MSINLKRIKDQISLVEKKYAWGIIGTSVSVLFGIIGLFSIFNIPTKSISFQIIDQIPVFNINKQITGLTILFNSQDILSKKRNLVLTRIRVKNTGNVEILPEQFDKQDPWGIEVQNGKIIEGRIFDASSDYVKNKARPKIIKNNIYEIEKIIFEKNQYLTFELLSIVEDGSMPNFRVLGKISGIDSMHVSEKIENPNEIKDDLFEFWNKVHYGGIEVHLTRFALYIFYTFVLFMILSMMFSYKSTDNDNKKD